MATLKTREYLFRQKPRRGRHLLAVGLVAAASLLAVTITDGEVALAETRGAPDATVGARVYAAVGGAERLAFEAVGTGAYMRFLCGPGERACAEGPVTRLDRVATGDGGALYRDAAGVAVLRVARSGEARLLAGSDAVPDGLPVRGRTLLRTERVTARLTERLAS